MQAAPWIRTVSWFFLNVSSPGFAADALGGHAERRAALVHVRNYAGVPREALTAAEGIARTVLGRAGVESEWRHCTEPSLGRGPRCEPPAGPGEILLEVLGPRQCTALRGSSEVLGLALLPKDGSRASYAAVFLDKAEALARDSGASTAQVLGHAMAHEIGHLLLETPEHSATGLMRARWSGSELQRAAWGHLLFTPEQCARMRGGVGGRVPAPGRAALRVEPGDGP